MTRVSLERLPAVALDVDVDLALTGSRAQSGAYRKGLALSSLDEKADCARLDLREIDGRNMTFEGLKLAGSNFKNAQLKDSRFVRCDLSGCDLSETVLDGARFEECDLHQATFEDTTLQQAKFTRSDMRSVYMRDADLTGAVVSRSQLDDSAFETCALDDMVLDEVSVSRMEISGAADDRPASNLTLSSASGYGLKLQRLQLTGAHVSSGEGGLPGVVFDKVGFDRDCTLVGNFRNWSAHESRFEGAVLSGDFLAGELDGSTFEEARFVDADLRDTSRSSWSSRQSAFERVTFCRSQIDEDMPGVELVDCEHRDDLAAPQLKPGEVESFREWWKPGVEMTPSERARAESADYRSIMAREAEAIRELRLIGEREIENAPNDEERRARIAGLGETLRSFDAMSRNWSEAFLKRGGEGLLADGRSVVRSHEQWVHQLREGEDVLKHAHVSDDRSSDRYEMVPRT